MAPPEATRDVVIDLLREHVGPEREVAEVSDLVADLDLDSVLIVEILGAIEERLGIRIADAALVEVATVRDLIRAVEAARSDQVAPARKAE